jgi:hypothetical protein
LFRSFTGLTREEFDALRGVVGVKYAEFERRRLGRKDRIRDLGGGRCFKHNLVDRLLMLLVYYRLYVTYSLAGFLFDLDESNVWRNVRIMEPVVTSVIPLPWKLYQKSRRVGTREELEEVFPEFKAFLDATEQEIPRPKNKRRRKSHYSGKKKRHTVKTQVMVNKDGVILHNTPYVRGRRHDYDLFKDHHPLVPPKVTVGVDLGYLGVEKDFPELNTRLPAKRRKGKPLTPREKRRNRKLAQERVVVEHSIRRIKEYKIVGDRFRNQLTRYNTIFSLTCGLVNFALLYLK